LQQLREAIPSDHSYRFLIQDQQVKAFGLRVLHTPARAPKANAYCERLVGSVRRECLDFMISLGEKHLRRILAEWVPHYNQGRPHLSLGPGIPDHKPQIPSVCHVVIPRKRCHAQNLECGSHSDQLDCLQHKWRKSDVRKGKAQRNRDTIGGFRNYWAKKSEKAMRKL